MYYVDLYKNNNLFLHAPFESKETAIKYFNLRLDAYCSGYLSFDRIEIKSDNTVLFDYEV